MRKKKRQPLWQKTLALVLFLLMGAIAFSLWSPGMDIQDGRHDRGKNGIWIEHGWLGDDDWFKRHRKIDSKHRFRSPEAITALHATLNSYHILDVFPHLCPTSVDGSLPGIDSAQAFRLISGLPGIRVIPWIGGVRGKTVFLSNPQWRSSFVASVAELLQTYPFAGIHINIEPCPSGDTSFLLLLEELRSAIPQGNILSVAAYPPPTILHPFNEVHWNEDYFREVSSRSDQLAVMLYDTALISEKLYIHLMSLWTRESLNWSNGKNILLGVPAYSDQGVGYHVPRVENLKNALLGIHKGLASFPELPHTYQGVAIYCLWEMDDEEWNYFEAHFLHRY